MTPAFAWPSWTPIAVSVGAAMVVALLGGLLTDVGPWYTGLKQPAWKPPDWAFGPIWTVIFSLAATAGVLGWRHAPSPPARAGVLLLFALNGGLNVLWSLLYFRLRRPDWALREVVPLWLSVLALIVWLARFTPMAAWMLVPYLVWVGIATLLNWTTVRLNGPFGGASAYAGIGSSVE